MTDLDLFNEIKTYIEENEVKDDGDWGFASIIGTIDF